MSATDTDMRIADVQATNAPGSTVHSTHNSEGPCYKRSSVRSRKSEVFTHDRPSCPTIRNRRRSVWGRFSAMGNARGGEICRSLSRGNAIISRKSRKNSHIGYWLVPANISGFGERTSFFFVVSSHENCGNYRSGWLRLVHVCGCLCNLRQNVGACGHTSGRLGSVNYGLFWAFYRDFGSYWTLEVAGTGNSRQQAASPKNGEMQPAVGLYSDHNTGCGGAGWLYGQNFRPVSPRRVPEIWRANLVASRTLSEEGLTTSPIVNGGMLAPLSDVSCRKSGISPKFGGLLSEAGFSFWFFSSDIGFLIAGVHTAMMEAAGAADNCRSGMRGAS